MIPRYRLGVARSLGFLLGRKPDLLRVVNDRGEVLGIVTFLQRTGDTTELVVRVSDGLTLPARLTLPDGAELPPAL
jgi:hypothetical protein